LAERLWAPSAVAGAPGATRPHLVVVSGLEYGATVPRVSVAPTTKASRLAKSSFPGPRAFGLPDATTGTAPAAHASSMAASNERSKGAWARGLSPRLR